MDGIDRLILTITIAHEMQLHGNWLLGNLQWLVFQIAKYGLYLK
jgi:hypothetical protein